MKLKEEEKVKLRDSVYRINMSDLGSCIHELKKSEWFWEEVSEMFPNIDLDNDYDVILNELETYQFSLGMKLK
jgi:hypothetical protein